MRQRIYAIIGVYLGTTKSGLRTENLDKQLENEFMMICKFKQPTYSMKRRWDRAIEEVSDSLIAKDPYFRDN